jgi:hypothetical protein
MNKRSQEQPASQPPPDVHAQVIVERTRVSTTTANVQVTELHLSDAARRALNLPQKSGTRRT